jgi:pimeloyl-ACP methyl ester carboxylesterase
VTVDVAETLVEGPWRHRFVAANGARFHVAEAGSGPLVLLLHGFPEFWWAWRAQLVALAEAGYHAVAMDLRGYGASDKPPRGYDTPTSAADVAGVVRALGAQQATIIGHDWGGWIAWSMPGLQPRVTRAVGAVGMAHPLTLRASLAGRRQRRSAGRLLAFQAPLAPERAMGDKDGVARVLRAWAGPGWPDIESEERYTQAMKVPFVAHTSMEYYRWAVRSVLRSDGRRFAAAVRDPVRVPVLQIHGGLDRWVLPETAAASSSRVDAPLRFELLPAVGHFPPEEAPGQVNAILLDWLGSLRRVRVRPLSSSGH